MFEIAMISLCFAIFDFPLFVVGNSIQKILIYIMRSFLMDTMDCTVAITADYMSKKWMFQIVLELYKKDFRFNDLKKRLGGVTAKVLTGRLVELEKEGLVGRAVIRDSVPKVVEYSLTESGRDFVKVIQEMKKWALKWKIDNPDCLGQHCENCLI